MTVIFTVIFSAPAEMSYGNFPEAYSKLHINVLSFPVLPWGGDVPFEKFKALCIFGKFHFLLLLGPWLFKPHRGVS